MSFGSNLQFMRKMHNSMTQEELAEKLDVSRQTISKWEMGGAFPEMEKAIALCQMFNCKLDELLLENMDLSDKAYVNVRVQKLPELRYVRYAVISAAPEEDAIGHMMQWANTNQIKEPQVIGWDFPFVSQEQTNVFHMHGYCAACILEEDKLTDCKEVLIQPSTNYAVITIENPYINPFVLIPNAYKTLNRYIEVNGYKHTQSKELIACFEKSYEINGLFYIDIYLAVE